MTTEAKPTTAPPGAAKPAAAPVKPTQPTAMRGAGSALVRRPAAAPKPPPKPPAKPPECREEPTHHVRGMAGRNNCAFGEQTGVRYARLVMSDQAHARWLEHCLAGKTEPDARSHAVLQAIKDSLPEYGALIPDDGEALEECWTGILRGINALMQFGAQE